MAPSKDGLTLEGLMARIASHEAVCAVRYAALIERLKRLEMVIWGAISALMISLLALITHKLWGM